MSTVNEVGRYQGRRPRSRAGAGLSGREAMLLLIPALLPIVILSVIPLGRGIYLGFTDSQAGLNFDTNFIGLDNFRALIHDDLFINSFKIGLIWSVAVTAIGFCFALGLALLLSQDLQGPLARPLARARPLGDAVGDRRDHVEALLPAAGGDPERDPPPLSHSGRDDGLALELHLGAAGGDPRRRLGGDAADHDRAPRRAPVDPGRAARGGRGRRRDRLAALPHDHAAPAEARDHRDHDARLHLELQLVRPRLRPHRRRPGREDPATDAVRLQPGVRVRPVRLRRGARLRDGGRDLRRARSSTSGAG